jgi:hypothetical protein
MSSATRDVKKPAKAGQRRRLNARERLERDRLQAQQAAKALEQAPLDLGIPEDLMAEVEGRLRSQQRLLGKICGVMFPPYSVATPTLNCAAYGAVRKTCRRGCSVRCPRAPRTAGSAAWA